MPLLHVGTAEHGPARCNVRYENINHIVYQKSNHAYYIVLYCNLLYLIFFQFLLNHKTYGPVAGFHELEVGVCLCLLCVAEFAAERSDENASCFLCWLHNAWYTFV
jgi:hypothetical protein